MKKQLFSALIMFIGCVFTIQAAAPKYTVEVTQNHANYNCKVGDDVQFTVTVKKDGKIDKTGDVYIYLFKSNIYKSRKVYQLTAANPITVKTKATAPGFISLFIQVYRDDKYKYSHRPIAVACEPEKIKAGTSPPSDLITYWQGEYKNLKKNIPSNFTIKKAGSTRTAERFIITADNFGGTKIYAALTVPKGKKGPFPLILTVPPAGNYGYAFSEFPGAMRMTIQVFDRLFKSNKEYRAFNKPDWYFHKGAQKRETYYYYKAVLGVMRMMDYAETLKDWDGKNLIASGRSQGGFFAIAMAALNPKIQALTADQPALCDHNAHLAGRGPGWPQLLKKVKTASAEGAKYYDAANFATFVKCPAIVSVGYIDTMATPSSILAAYNNLQGPKKLYEFPLSGHGWGKSMKNYRQAVNAFIKENFKK